MVELSVIVPIYNVERYLTKAIDSLIVACDDKCEIILVDDGSTDSSGDICDTYKNIKNITIVHKENGGLPSSRKAGFSVSKGNYIGFLDGDDWVEKDYYLNMIDVAKKFNADVVASSFQYDYSQMTIKAAKQVDSGLYDYRNIELLRKQLLYHKPYYTFGVFPSLCMKIIKREYIEKFLLKAPNYLTLAEDAVCSYPIMFGCNTICILDDNIGYHYRQHNQSMSYAPDMRKIEKIINALEYFEQVFIH